MEVFVKINGKQHYLWREVDQDGEIVDVFLQTRRDGAAAKRFFKRLLRLHNGEPRKIVTDKLRSYGVARREVIPEVIHDTSKLRIIGSSNRMSQRGYGSEECGNSSRSAKLRGFWYPCHGLQSFQSWSPSGISYSL